MVDMTYLDWPEERVAGKDCFESWFAHGSNICLDFHGDPTSADLIVFSDGNHHMALKECLEYFQGQYNGAGLFYATTPPGPIVKMIKDGGLQLGNLILRASPNIFISPPDIMESLAREKLVLEYQPFVRNQGNVLLVRKNNPESIKTVRDLRENEIRLFLSNPQTEKSSYQNYYSTLENISGITGFVDDLIKSGQVYSGKNIHHREAPQAVADGNADAAVVFYHLGLRYVRIFPDIFDIIPLKGSVEKPEPLPGNVIGTTCIGLVGDGGRWGRKFLSFMKSEKAVEIYKYHGLLSWDGEQVINRI